MSSNNEYNVGIIGLGFIGKVHAYGYLTLPLFYDPVPLKARITHVCSSRLETARAAAAQIGAPCAVADFRQITENPAVDIVHICTPNHLHAEALLSAMMHQKHIYCDKPLTATLAEAEAIERALPAYRGTAQMTLQNRFYPSVMRARQLVEEGFLGRILEFRACHLHAGSADAKAPLKWKLDAAAGGGVIADLGSHLLDLIQCLAGDYAALFAATRIAYPTRPSVDDSLRQEVVTAEDGVMMLARMQNGALGSLEATKIATGTEDEVRFEIHGERGALRYNGMDPHHLGVYDATLADKPLGGLRGWTQVDCGQRYSPPASGFPGPKFAIGWMRSHLACLANFLGDVATGRPGDPGLRRGIEIQRLMECARESARSGQWVKT